MLNKLSYSVTFPTIGRTLAGSLNSSRDLGSLPAPRAGKESHHRGGSPVPIRLIGVAREGRVLQNPKGDS